MKSIHLVGAKGPFFRYVYATTPSRDYLLPEKGSEPTPRE
jgi:hypothetical protein